LAVCSVPHSENPSVLCDKTLPCFGLHANARKHLTWPGNPLPVRQEPEKGRGTRKAQLALIAQRARS
jgi:hypothetical protein